MEGARDLHGSNPPLAKKQKTEKVENLHLPALFYEKDILIPLKCDVTMEGARYVDSFTWSVYSLMSPYEFAQRTVADLSLPRAFANIIALQISEQVDSYRYLIRFFLSFSQHNVDWIEKVKKPLPIYVGIRHNTVDYSDKFFWDLTSSLSPESFARTKCADLGLPAEMEPAMSHKIRESIFRHVFSWVDRTLEEPTALDNMSYDAKVTMVPQGNIVEMIGNLWKRARPVNMDDCQFIPQPTLPVNKDSNASVWAEG